jgi:hypothetical protein
MHLMEVLIMIWRLKLPGVTWGWITRLSKINDQFFSC